MHPFSNSSLCSLRLLQPGLAMTLCRSFAKSPTSTVQRRWNSPSPPLLGGVHAALKASENPSFKPKRTIFTEFSLNERIAIVTGAKRGIGLELSMALAEAGAIVHSIDLQQDPGSDFHKAKDYVAKIKEHQPEVGSLSYLSVDISKQRDIWNAIESIASKEGRLDVAFANAGILKEEKDCLEVTDEEFQQVSEIT